MNIICPTENPLLDFWRDTYGPDAGHSWLERDGLSYRREERWDAIGRWGFAIPTAEALDAIAEHGPVVEVGAGLGYWSWLLRRRDVDVVAYDLWPPPCDRNYWWPDGEPWTEIRFGSQWRAARHADRTLLLIWPDYTRSWATEAIEHYAACGGRTICYVGEGAGGCTGDDRLYELLDRWDLTREVDLPQWDGINDYLEVRCRP